MKVTITMNGGKDYIINKDLDTESVKHFADEIQGNSKSGNWQCLEEGLYINCVEAQVIDFDLPKVKEKPIETVEADVEAPILERENVTEEKGTRVKNAFRGGE